MNFCFQCDRKLLKDSSFNGDAYLEVKSQPLQRKCSFGFNFQTYLANGVLLLSTFYGQSARDDLGMVSHTDMLNPIETLIVRWESQLGLACLYNGNNSYKNGFSIIWLISFLDNFYSMSLVDGKLQLKLSASSGGPLVFTSTSTFNDGKIHSVFITKVRFILNMHFLQGFKKGLKWKHGLTHANFCTHRDIFVK